ncbi:hypothetical protein CspHIS471_0611210 [Cutaneotrichosporon sp. HIS471]|nr:hypothetical protein CspHIS471_0611210 [Cutaneotrichosporon sp. HIS471]
MASNSTADIKQDRVYEERQIAFEPVPVTTAPAATPMTPANPATLGFFSLGTTTLMVGLLVIQARGVPALTMLVGQVLAVGGLGMLISGLMCYQQGATFATTAFGMYGLFYISFGIVLWPSSGASAGYADPVDNNNALGLYLITWFVLSLVMLPVTFRLNIGLAVLFALVIFYFLFLAVGFMSGKTVITTIGGYFGILVGSWGYILGMETLYETENNIFKLPNPSLAPKPRN